jgi:hypothetical protein
MMTETLFTAYCAADRKLGDTCINDPWESRPPSVSYWRSALPWLTYDLPWIIFAAYAYCSDGSVPLKALMLLEQSVSTLTYHLQDVFRDGKTIAQWLQNLRQVYDAITIENKLVDGVVPYPQPNKPDDKETVDGDTGVKIEFKYVAILLSVTLCFFLYHEPTPECFRLQGCDFLVSGCSATGTARYVL